MTTTTHTTEPEFAYDKGWRASARSRTYDLDAAERRFESRYGTDTGAWFAAGWTDYAADLDYGTALDRREVTR
jgi:hypothetical protein